MAKNYLIASASPATWSTAGNWSLGAAPVSTDEVIIENSAISLNAGLAQSAVALALLRIPLTYTGQIGVAGHAGTYLAIGAAKALIGEPGRSDQGGNGSGMLKLDFGTAGGCDCLVYNTSANSAESGLEPVRIKGAHASHKLTVLGGRVGVATSNPAETATWPAISLAGGALGLGAGVTWTDIWQTGGTLEIASGGSDLVQTAGTLTTRGTVDITNLTIGGTANLWGRAASGDSIDVLEILPGGTVDFGVMPIAIGTLKLHRGCNYRFSRANPGMLTVTTIEYLGGAGEVGVE